MKRHEASLATPEFRAVYSPGNNVAVRRSVCGGQCTGNSHIVYQDQKIAMSDVIYVDSAFYMLVT